MFWIRDGLETGVVVWQRTTVSCALNVVLPTHRVDTRPLAPDITGHQGKITETLHVLNATDVFRDS